MKFKITPCAYHGKCCWILAQTDFKISDVETGERHIDIFDSVTEARVAAGHVQEPAQEFEVFI